MEEEREGDEAEDHRPREVQDEGQEQGCQGQGGAGARQVAGQGCNKGK